ncbi:hypothetical protein PR048_008227 [Dryococelus australis]|uniref:Uncharacterized protein n=1 Tax=Dryococelus australis TaxID=614101 RepID=A0ABQ9HWI2_9NEOP|nr:hypothetical protein PR048_008227 [Dryococelus australis]
MCRSRRDESTWNGQPLSHNTSRVGAAVARLVWFYHRPPLTSPSADLPALPPRRRAASGAWSPGFVWLFTTSSSLPPPPSSNHTHARPHSLFLALVSVAPLKGDGSRRSQGEAAIQKGIRAVLRLVMPPERKF